MLKIEDRLIYDEVSVLLELSIMALNRLDNLEKVMLVQTLQTVLSEILKKLR